MKRRYYRCSLHRISWLPVRASARDALVLLALFAGGGMSVAADLPRLRVSDSRRYLITEDDRRLEPGGDTRELFE